MADQGTTTFPDLDIDLVRTQFPAFGEPSLAGQYHFDNAGGSYACSQVIDGLTRFYRETKVQPYGLHPASRRAGEEMDRAHERLASYLGVGPDEVHLGPSTSQNLYVLAQAVMNRLQPGDEIVVTNQDHEANSGVWRRLQDRGIVIREWTIDPETGSLALERLDALLNEKTKVVAFPHCSNVIAEINPVARICARVHAVSAIAIVDGVSYAGHGLPDVAALGADIYLFSFYKVFGPHLGAMVVRATTRDWLGNQGHYFNGEFTHKWFVPAGPDHAQVAAVNGVFDYFDLLYAHHFGDDDRTPRPEGVRAMLRQAELAFLPDVLDFFRNSAVFSLIGPADASIRAANVAVLPKFFQPRDISAKLAGHGIIAGAGHFYAVRALEALGVDPATGVLRLSFAHYNNRAEIAHLLEVLEKDFS